MEFKAFAFSIFGLFGVFFGLLLSDVGALSTDTAIFKKSVVPGENLKESYKNIVVSLEKHVSHKEDQTYFRLVSHESLTFNFMIIMSDEEIKKDINNLLNKEKLCFSCKDEIVDYIIKKEVNNVAFLKNNCIELNLESYLFQPTKRKLMQESKVESESELTFDLDQGDSNKDSENCEVRVQEPYETNLEAIEKLINNTETEKTSSCCGKKKNKFDELRSAIPDDFEQLFENSNELDGFNVTEIVHSKDGAVGFEIEINDRISIFDEILGALKSEGESILNYDSIEERDLSSSELKEALKETEREINNRKVEMRSLKEASDPEAIGSRSRSKLLRSTQTIDQINLKIRYDISGTPLHEIAKMLTYRFIQTENKKIERYFTRTKTKLLYLAIYEYLFIYSTLEHNLEKVVQIINGKNGILKLRLFFENYINFAAMQYVFEQYFARFDYVQKKRIYYKSDFTRFMLNLIINHLDPKLTSPIFNLKLEIGSMIIFYSENDPEMQTIVINEEINNTDKQAFYRDNVFFNFLLVKHFSVAENNKVLEKTSEIIVRNRNKHPLDRPEQCFIQIKQLLFKQNIFRKIQNNEVLKVICSQTYGLLGLYSAFDKL
ncbi:uncharacterized protein ELE39_002521 [Cryptosporidium sp. chipmunk genotype I]|uniref:uncharacterized protein n=1 Tax=Cryptosporidium sp. chipmunk genotype I TaxID=1280935 RepID=UPI00351A1D5F|nr:hypothetical protein ELE39_002521 [Cryptosporidium sp. chipmunk genotype I]